MDLPSTSPFNIQTTVAKKPSVSRRATLIPQRVSHNMSVDSRLPLQQNENQLNFTNALEENPYLNQPPMQKSSTLMKPSSFSILQRKKTSPQGRMARSSCLNSGAENSPNSSMEKQTRIQRNLGIYASQSRNLVPRDNSKQREESKSLNRPQSTYKNSSISLKPKKKFYGVLGVTKIDEDDPLGAYYKNRDNQGQRPFGLKELYPNLKLDYDQAKKKFSQLLNKVDKEIKENEQIIVQKKKDQQFTQLSQFQKLQAKQMSWKTRNEDESPYQHLRGKTSTHIIGKNQQKQQDDADYLMKLQEQLLIQQNQVNIKLGGVRTKVNQQDQKLGSLRETNKYFFRLTSPSPLLIAQQNYEKLKKKQKGEDIDERLEETEQDDPLNCTPDQIAQYVEKLRKQERREAKDQYQGFTLEIDQNKKSKIKHTKQVYTVCADYHQATSILAISLIDKEVKIYRVKQNGQKVSIVENFSFQVKMLVACLNIEQFAVNNKPILCLGGQSGDISIYYIEQVQQNISTSSSKLDPIQFKQVHLFSFNFFSRGREDLRNRHAMSQYEMQSAGDSQQQSSHPRSSSLFQPLKLKQQSVDSSVVMNQNHGLVENELTKLRYVKDIGLISTSLNGTIKIFDAFDFKLVWKSTNKSRKEQYHTNIVTFDVSPTLGLMATGGVEGKLILIDPYALGIVNSIMAHHCEINGLYIYDSQQQIFTIGVDRSIALWDAYRLEKIQAISDTHQTHTPKYTSTTFDRHGGVLYTGCQQLKVWESKVDSQEEIKAIQVETLTKIILKERQEENRESEVKGGEGRNGSILVSNQSELVDILINEKDDQHFVITVDSDNLLRVWSMKTSSTTLSYKLPSEKRVTAAAIDKTCTYIACGNHDGEAFILNLKSGGVLYHLPHTDQEVTCMKFLEGLSEFWLIGGCWQGKVMMWTNPSEYNNYNLSAKCKIGHKDDILVLDSSKNYIATGGTDGLLSIWNSFSGILKYAVSLPPPSFYFDETNEEEDYFIDDSDNQEEVKNSEIKSFYSSPKQSLLKNQLTNISDLPKVDPAGSIKKNIVGLCFHPYSANLVCVLQEGGDIHVVDASNGTVCNEYIAKVKVNSNWACDVDNQMLFVVGDVGRACVFNMSMINAQIRKKFMNQVSSVESPISSKRKSSFTKNKWGQSAKWEIKKNWFTAHHIHKMDNTYVVSVKFATSTKIFVSGTSKGEVKLWDNIKYECLGILNSNNWDPKKMMDAIHEANRQEKEKIREKDEKKKKESNMRVLKFLN